MKRVMPGTGQVTLGDQLSRINRFTLAVALALVAVIIIASSFTMSLLALVDSNRVKARVLADNASASLMFMDSGSAQELLQSLHYSQDINAVALYGKNGQPFARYAVSGHSVPA
mgnify:CR=1 FL=1